MARGGKRDGAGRPKGSKNKRANVAAAKLTASGAALPLDILLASARQLFGEGKYAEAASAAAKAAPYIHQRFTATQEPAIRHQAQQVQGELPLSPPPGAQPEPDIDSWDGVLN